MAVIWSGAKNFCKKVCVIVAIIATSCIFASSNNEKTTATMATQINIPFSSMQSKVLAGNKWNIGKIDVAVNGFDKPFELGMEFTKTESGWWVIFKHSCLYCSGSPRGEAMEAATLKDVEVVYNKYVAKLQKYIKQDQKIRAKHNTKCWSVR